MPAKGPTPKTITTALLAGRAVGAPRVTALSSCR
jgi:hypothetical protein